MAVLGSREQLCIHDHVSLLRGKTQTNACHALCKKRTKQYCAHFSRVTDFVKKNSGLGVDPIDIEDLVNIGKSSGPCPYYLSRELHKSVDILFAPYNYLIDRGNRKSLTIDWNNSILIFDEAHNLEGLCADAASFDLSSGLLTACISEAKSCVDLSITRREMSSDKSCNPDNFAILRALLLKLENRIAEVPIESKELGFTKDGPYIYELLAELNITQETGSMLSDIIDEACILLEEDANTCERGGSNKTNGFVCRLESMGDILKLIFRDNGTAHAPYYRFHVQEVEAGATDLFKGKISRTLSWWCFNPGIAMEEFSRLGVGSIILTSGTLSPLDSFAEELKLEFPIRLENPHVISGNQIWAGVAPVGPSGFSFNSSYRSRGTVEYKLELGNAIVNFSRIVPDGLLVFFPSYYLMEQCINCWKTYGQQNLTNGTTIWERISKLKSTIVEPRQSSLFPSAIEDYTTMLKNTSTSGAIFFAVCRGKVSEGLDFADHAGRAVVITGLPFAAMTEPKVRLKREYLDRQAQSKRIERKCLTGEEWYSQQASRAVNQAVGRVIRHQHDYGAIIFCDERFTYSNRQSQLSLWIQPHVKCHSKFGDVVYTLTRFFRDCGTRGPLKVESAQNKVQENAKVSQSSCSQFPDKTSRLLSVSLNIQTSAKEIKQGTLSGKLKEMLPANRSYLTSDMHFQDSPKIFSSDLANPRRKTLICGNKLKDVLDTEIGEAIVSSSLKKPKLLLTGPDILKRHEQYDQRLKILVKHENSELSKNVIGQNPQNSEEMASDENSIPKKNVLLTNQGNIYEDIVSGSSGFVHGNDEKKGSAFLSEVREKLTDAEYKEFVGFMKSLKLKEIKTGLVLQSIARLFSSPDRLSLLHGFKDYVPTKYQSLYEQYLHT